MKKSQKLKIKLLGNFPSKNQNVKVSISLFILILHSLFATSAFAVSGAEHHAFAWKDLIWPVINFTVLVVILVLAARKPIKEYFRKRTEQIEKSIKDAEEAKELAKKSLEEVRERLRNTDQEIQEILDAAKKSGEKEKEMIIAEGEELKNKILEQAKANIEFELQKAKKAIKSEAAIMALELAEKSIKEKLGKEEQHALIDEYIKKLEGKN
jgi:F-type H+-transporting ATPase subunit b